MDFNDKTRNHSAHGIHYQASIDYKTLSKDLETMSKELRLIFLKCSSKQANDACNLLNIEKLIKCFENVEAFA